MSDPFFDQLRIPDACRLDKPLYKKLFLDNADLKPPTRRL